MKKIFFLTALFLQVLVAGAQPTMGLMLNSPDATEGYTLFAPMSSHTTYLIDNCGHEVHNWMSNYSPGLSVYFLNDGTLLRTGNAINNYFPAGGEGGIIEQYDWSNNLTWSFLYSDSMHCQHHDIHQMPNGHVLAIAWERKSHAVAVSAGRNPLYLAPGMWTEEIIEIDPQSNNIVWEWHLWDHNIQDFDSTKNNYGVISNHPELVDLNYSHAMPDVYHINGIDYNPVLDQVLMSVHQFNEVWIIDHSTSSAEASSHSGGKYGHGGDLLYRWGNPEAYQMGSTTDKKFWGQHNPSWIPDSLRLGGGIMVFNNGLGMTTPYSSIDIIQPPMDSAGYYSHNTAQPYGPADAVWSYSATPNTSFYSAFISGVEPMQRGHYLICEGDNGVFFEIDSLGNTIWKYINPVSNVPQTQGSMPINNSVFRCTRYASDYSGFNGLTLSTGNLIELNPLPDTCSLFSGIANVGIDGDFEIYPVPANKQLNILINNQKACSVFVYNLVGEEVISVPAQAEGGLFTLDVSGLPSGVYFLKINNDKITAVEKFLKQ